MRYLDTHFVLLLVHSYPIHVQRIKALATTLYGSTIVNMSGIGSVFLGDNQRFRNMLSSTPPSSPQARSPVSMTAGFPISPTHSPKQSISKAPPPPPPPPVIDPALSLELRLRWLEAILLGVRQDAKDRKGKDKSNELKHGETLIKLAEDVRRRLHTTVESNDGLKRFMDHCASNLP